MALPGVEITITLDDDVADASDETRPESQTTFTEQADAQRQEPGPGQSQEQPQGQPGPRPRLLPFLSEIRNRGPKSAGIRAYDWLAYYDTLQIVWHMIHALRTARCLTFQRSFIIRTWLKDLFSHCAHNLPQILQVCEAQEGSLSSERSLAVVDDVHLPIVPDLRPKMVVTCRRRFSPLLIMMMRELRSQDQGPTSEVLERASRVVSCQRHHADAQRAQNRDPQDSDDFV